MEELLCWPHFSLSLSTVLSSLLSIGRRREEKLESQEWKQEPVQFLSEVSLTKSSSLSFNPDIQCLPSSFLVTLSSFRSVSVCLPLAWVCICLTRIKDDTKTPFLRVLYSFSRFMSVCVWMDGSNWERSDDKRRTRVTPFNDSEWKQRVDFSSFLPLPYPKGILDVCVSFSPFRDSWSVSKFLLLLFLPCLHILINGCPRDLKTKERSLESFLIPSLETSEEKWRPRKVILLLPQVMSYPQDVSLSIILMTVTASYPSTFA